MKKNLYMALLVIFNSTLIVGCGEASLTPAGRQVQVVHNVTPTDLLYYDNIGTFSSYSMNSVDDCLNEIRNKASIQDADFVHTTSVEAVYCSWDNILEKNTGKNCFTVHADGFRKKYWP